MARRLAVLVLGLCLSGCAYILPGDPLAEPVGLLAVMPIEKGESRVDSDGRVIIEAEGANLVTAHIYGVLSQSPRWNFVSDVQVNAALRKVDANLGPNLRAVALGKATGAESVLFGSVSRFMDRVGNELGASSPASVTFELQLVSTKTGAVLWQGEFDETQKPLSENLLKWWMFWGAGPKWMSASELAALGVERLLDDLDRRIP